MTTAEKNKAEVLHKNGLGTTRIAMELGLSVNTVKSHFRRAANTPVVKKIKTPEMGHCKQCGTPLSQLPHHKAKLFCSDTCRHLWWNSHRNEITMRSSVTLICSYCGKHFDSYGSENRKYCSHACYIKDRFGGERHDTRAV